MRAPKKKIQQPARAPATQAQPEILKGWQPIAAFLGQPVSVAQRWAKTGMPVIRQGRSITASPEQFTAWLGHEAGGEPIHVTSTESDLSAELKRGLSYVRREKRH